MGQALARSRRIDALFDSGLVVCPFTRTRPYRDDFSEGFVRVMSTYSNPPPSGDPPPPLGDYAVMREELRIGRGGIFGSVPLENGALALAVSSGRTYSHFRDSARRGGRRHRRSASSVVQSDATVLLYDCRRNRIMAKSPSPGQGLAKSLCYFPTRSLLVSSGKHLLFWRVNTDDYTGSTFLNSTRARGSGFLHCRESLWPNKLFVSRDTPLSPAVETLDLERLRTVSSKRLDWDLLDSIVRVDSSSSGGRMICLARGGPSRRVFLWDPRSNGRMEEEISFGEHEGRNGTSSPATSVTMLAGRCDDLFWPKHREHIVVCCGRNGFSIYDDRNLNVCLGVQRTPQSKLVSGNELDGSRFVTTSWDPDSELGKVQVWNYEGNIAAESQFAGGFAYRAHYVPPVATGFERFEIPAEQVTRGKLVSSAKSRQRMTQSSPHHSMTYAGELSAGLVRIPIVLKRMPVFRKTGDLREDEGDDTMTYKLSDLERAVRMASSMRQENVQRCYGCFLEEDPHSPNTPFANVVLEHCPRDFREFAEGRTFSAAEKVTVLIQIARAIRQIHARINTHSALSIDKVLVSEDGLIKLGDLGVLLQSENASGSSLSAVPANPRYFAPNQGRHNRSNRNSHDDYDPRKADTYAFSVICWEIWTGEEAFESLSRQYDGDPRHPIPMLDRIQRGVRPDLNQCAEMPRKLKRLLARCWHGDPSLRPGFVEIVDELEDPEMFAKEARCTIM